jgi:catechol 2,3-dioxygenase-like lactoylglutathione lyase family enzyme
MRLQHVSVAIPHDGAAEARAFYGGLLGLMERDVLPKLDPSRFIWFCAGDGCELHLMLTGEEPPRGPHFCLAVDTNLDALRARLEAAGIATRDGTELLGRQRFSCRDPFGNLIELTRLEGT